jgi:flagellar basal-body rod protein FlgC
MFNTLDIGASGLTAQRTRMDTIANNILNINTTRNAKGEVSPFRRRFAVLAAGQAGDASKPGVHVQKVMQDKSPFTRRFEPGHPDAGPDGYVSYPNIDLSIEYVNALEASRAYEANVTMMDVTKQMINSSLRLIA